MVNPFSDLKAGYKDYPDRSIILDKNDFIKEKEKCGNHIIDKIKIKKV